MFSGAAESHRWPKHDFVWQPNVVEAVAVTASYVFHVVGLALWSHACLKVQSMWHAAACCLLSVLAALAALLPFKLAGSRPVCIWLCMYCAQFWQDIFLCMAAGMVGGEGVRVACSGWQQVACCIPLAVSTGWR